MFNYCYYAKSSVKISGQAVLVHTPPHLELDAPAWLTVAELDDIAFTITSCGGLYVTLGTYIYNTRVNTYQIYLSNNNSTISKDGTQV